VFFEVQYPGKAPTTATAINMAARYRAFGSDQVADENFQMVIGDPLSLVGFTRSTTILERPEQGFRARSETTTNVWSETDGAGGYVFRYRASVKAFIGDATGTDRPFAEKTVAGEIARAWI
jgi:hypothetical protein